MKKLIIVFVLFIGIIILTSIIWRFLSQRVSIPCPSWLHWLVELDNPFARACHAKVIVENLELTPDMKVVDVGAGSGRVTIPLAQALREKGQVTAMDIQQGMLDVIQEKAQKENIHNIRLLQAGVGSGALEHNYYDRTILVMVLGEIPDQRAALEEIYNTLKPGGILSISESIFDPHFQSKKSVIALAESIGFQEKRYFGYWFAYTLHFEKQ